MKKYFILLFSVFLSQMSFAQTIITQDIKGTITDKITGEPLIGATIQIKNEASSTGVVTDEYGHYNLR